MAHFGKLGVLSVGQLWILDGFQRLLQPLAVEGLDESASTGLSRMLKAVFRSWVREIVMRWNLGRLAFLVFLFTPPPLLAWQVAKRIQKWKILPGIALVLVFLSSLCGS